MDSYLKALNKMTDLIKSRKELEEIKIIEEQIFSDKQIIPFIISFNAAQDDYNFVLSHFKDDEEKILEARNKLIIKKKEMDSIPLIKRYNELYEIITKDTLYLELGLKNILKSGEIKEC